MLKRGQLIVTAFLLLGILGCGGLRYSEMSPEARDFHPRAIAVLPSDSRAFAEARGEVDRIFADVLTRRGWFAKVLGGEEISRRMAADEAFRQLVSDYQGKLTNVSFSDQALSSRLGELTGTEAFVLVRVDYWNYATENDTKIGKVSLTLTLVEAKTGKIIWTAGHHRVSEYRIIKPDLPDVARALIEEMVGHMPR
jgi:hypothetical protein